MIGGTGYSITKGRTLIGGTGYDISFSNISTTLNDNEWATIRAVSDAGEGANYWSVGDTKTIVLNGTVGTSSFSNFSIDVFILGFNHNSAYEGTSRIHFKIGKISGVSVALVDSFYSSSGSSASRFQMNSSSSNNGGWNASSMRKTLLGNDGTPSSPTSNSLLAALSPDLRAVMKSCTKYSDNTGGGNNIAGFVTSTTDYLWLPSEWEYQGTRTYANSTEQNYQSRYAYYQAGNSKIKYKHNATTTAAIDWCRSVWCDDNSSFCSVSTSGNSGIASANNSWGLSPGFCV